MIFCFLFDTIISKFKTSKVKLFNIIPKTFLCQKIKPIQLMKPARFGFLVNTGNGRQYMPLNYNGECCGN